MESTIFHGGLQLNGIMTVFPDCEIYLCEFHREQAWTRWIRNGKVVLLVVYIAISTATYTLLGTVRKIQP